MLDFNLLVKVSNNFNQSGVMALYLGDISDVLPLLNLLLLIQDFLPICHGKYGICIFQSQTEGFFIVEVRLYKLLVRMTVSARG